MALFHRHQSEHRQIVLDDDRAAPEGNPGPDATRAAAAPENEAGRTTAVQTRRTTSYAEPYADHSSDYSADGATAAWEARSRIVLTPIAAPSILGLFGFMGATVMVGAWFAGWYGTAATPLVLFPFAAWFGGVAQFISGLYAYRARDGVATAMHGLWGSFWIAFGIQQLLVATHVLPAIPLGAANPSFAWWFIVLALITGMGGFASLADNLGMFLVLGLLAVGSGFTAAAFWGGYRLSITIAGYLFVASAAAAWYTASAMMLKNTFGRVILPIGEYAKHKNIPGRIPAAPIQYEQGMPGAKIGQ